MKNKTYYQKRAKEIIDELNYLTLATVSGNGTPWNSPVWFEQDKNYNLYFGSPKYTQHSKNIRANGKSFVVIYDSRAPEGDGDGVYMTGTVKELNKSNEIKKGIEVLFHKDAHTFNEKQFSGGHF